jgi:hypothetical protein
MPPQGLEEDPQEFRLDQPFPLLDPGIVVQVSFIVVGK